MTEQRVDISGFLAVGEEIAAIVREDAVKLTAAIINKGQLDRSAKGQGVSESFEPVGLGGYKSKSWAAKRSAAGLQTSFVDLRFTGRMLGDIRLEGNTMRDGDPNKGKVFGNQERYGFFRATREDMEAAGRGIADLIQRKLALRRAA